MAESCRALHSRTLKVTEFHMVQNKAPIQAWGFALLFGGWCLNDIAIKSLGVTPHELMMGETSNLSVFQFEFWQKLKYLDPSSQYPSSRMKSRNFLSIAEYLGDAYTYWIYTQNGQILAQSCIQPINEPATTPDEMSLQGRILKEDEEGGTFLWKNPLSTALPEILIDADEGTPPLDTDYEEDGPSADDEQLYSVYDDLINDDDEVKLFDMVAVTVE